MLITIIVAGAVAAAAGVIVGQRDPEPAVVPARVDRPRRNRRS